MNVGRGTKLWGMLLAVILVMSVLSACGGSAKGEQQSGGNGSGADSGDKKIKVLASIGQIAEPIEVIGGDRVEVTALMGPGVDPHLHQPTQGDIAKLESSDVILYSGLHLEANLAEPFQQIGKNKPVVAVAEAIAKDKLMQDGEDAVDPHVWFDIDLWKEALSAGVEALKEYSPADADYFEANKTAYFAELDQLKAEAASKLGEIADEQRKLVTAHDAFGYFGRAYNVEVIGLQGLSTETEVALSDIEETVQLLIAHKIPAVFVESSINPASINSVIEGVKQKGHEVKLGGELYSDAMGDAGTEEGTYLGMYRHNIETIYEALIGNEG